MFSGGSKGNIEKKWVNNISVKMGNGYCFSIQQLPRAKNTSALSKGGFSRLAKGIGEAVSKMTSKMTEPDAVRKIFSFKRRE